MSDRSRIPCGTRVSFRYGACRGIGVVKGAFSVPHGRYVYAVQVENVTDGIPGSSLRLHACNGLTEDNSGWYIEDHNIDRIVHDFDDDDFDIDEGLLLQIISGETEVLS